MDGDKEYFEKYFAICELFQEKESLLERMWDSDRLGHLRKSHYQCRNNISTLNALILDEEVRLHKEVISAEADGAVFAFETFVRKYRLTAFDRRLVLFFLHLDLFRVGHVAFGRRELAGILDCEGTAISRSNVLLDLFPGSRLYKKKLITEILGGSEVRLAIPIRDKLRKLVSGRRFGGVRDKKGDEENDCGIGLVSQPEYKMEDVVLAPEKLQEVLLHVDTHQRMMKIGVMKDAKRGKGLGMLFYGPPGTGKSMLAHALAAHLKKKVLQVSVSQVKNKYVGESEKNIVRIFKSAKEKGCVICLDEADSLISSREGASHGWEMSEANVFLEEVEKFNGILIMTTNMEDRLDPALERRVSLRVRFDIPDTKVRQMIWQKHIPASVKCSGEIDWACLGECYAFSGGYIKNAALSAIRHMLSRNSEVLEMEDLVFGAEHESKSLTTGRSKGPMGFLVSA